MIMSNSIIIAHQRGERDASLERNWRAINEWMNAFPSLTNKMLCIYVLYNA